MNESDSGADRAGGQGPSDAIDAAAFEGPSLRQGLVAGVLGGATVVLFFFALDLVQGELFRTPRDLADFLFGGGDGVTSGGLVAAFTVLHFGAFALLGGGMALLCRWARLPANMLLGGIYGLFVATLLFYLSLLLTGAEVLQAPPWPGVLVGNLLAGFVMGGYLHWRGPVRGVAGLGNQLEAHPVVREGLIAGTVGAVLVALWFLGVDAVLREPLYTPGALGSAIFLGAVDPSGVRIGLATVAGYSVIHVAGFLMLGVVASGLVTQAERFPPLVFALLLLFVVFEVLFVGLSALLGVWLLEELAWWSILAGNLLAAAGMGTYLWRAHPILQEKIRTGAVWSA